MKNEPFSCFLKRCIVELAVRCNCDLQEAPQKCIGAGGRALSRGAERTKSQLLAEDSNSKKYRNQQLTLFYPLLAAVCDFSRHASSAMRTPRFRNSKHRDDKDSRSSYPRTLEPLLKGDILLQPLEATWLGGSVCSGRGTYLFLAENSGSRCCPIKSGTLKTRKARCKVFLI